MKKRVNLSLILIAFASCANAAILSTIPAADGAASFSFVPTNVPLGAFTFAPVSVASIKPVTVFGYFGNNQDPGGFDVSTAPSDYFLGLTPGATTVEVAACDDSVSYAVPCSTTGTNSGTAVAWSYTLSTADLTALTPGFISGALYFTAVQNGPGSVNIGDTTLTSAPEPATFLIAAGGLLGLFFLRSRRKAAGTLAAGALALITGAAQAQQVATYTQGTAPSISNINGGPWNLAQGAPYTPASNTGPTTSGGAVSGATPYCNPKTAISGAAIVNPLSVQNPMQPFYFPFVTGRGSNLQGYFDYRPRNINESTVVASSPDGGNTWNFQQQVESLTPYCPTTDTNSGAANGNDSGLGHPFVVTIGGSGLFYLLDRRGGHIDSDGLFVHTLTPKAGMPLFNIPGAAEIQPPAASQLIAGWDLTNYPGATLFYTKTGTGATAVYSNNPPTGPAPSVFHGVATHSTSQIASASSQALGMANNYSFPTSTGSVDAEDLTITGGGSDPNPQSLAWRVRGPGNNFNGQGNGWNTAAPQYTQGVQFLIDTTGYFNVVFQYDWYTTAQSVRDLQAQYTINGSTWTNVGPVQVAPAGGGYFPQITINFPALGITAVNNNPNFGIRLVSAYDTSAGAPTPATYTSATLSATGTPVVINNTSGNWRFDEVNVLGTASQSSTIPMPVKTAGLLHPDGILAQVPNTFPFKILYVDKILNGDFAFPTAQQCAVAGASGSINHDTESIHMATSTDGVHWTDQGAVNGLNDPTNTSSTGIRYMAPNGSLVKLPGGKWGLFFGGGNCLDGDSDGFHAIMYAESADLVNWTVYNGIGNPILTNDPNIQGVLGRTQTWFSGRVYNPQAIWSSPNSLNLIFAGYDSAYSGDISNYRTIGHAVLSTTTVLP